MLGVRSEMRLAYPTADGSPGWATALNPQSCRDHPATSRFENTPGSGRYFKAVLIYPGNYFEGFFTIEDPPGHTKAYTVYLPGGPFEDQNYYYLQVLRYAMCGSQGPCQDEFWVWDGSQQIGDETVLDGQEVPNAAHVPVPEIPQ